MEIMIFMEFCLQKHQYSITPIAISGKAEFSRKSKNSAEKHENQQKVDFMWKSLKFMEIKDFLQFSENN